MAAMMTAAREPAWSLIWQGRDVTKDLVPYVTSIRYSDELGDQSDELGIEIENRSGRFWGAWLPVRGDAIELALGYAGEPLVRIGAFEIDEVSFAGPPDTVSLRCLAAGVAAALRTGADTGHESVTLREIADTVAKRNQLQLVGGGGNPGRVYARITQHRESDLAFLNRLGRAEGVVFSIKDRQLVWHGQPELDAAAPALTLERTAVSSYSITLATATTYRECRVSYHDPATKQLISATSEAQDVPSGDTLTLVERCETKAQAQGKADAALRAANGPQVEGQIALPGNPQLRAGVNVSLVGWGTLDRTLQITRAEHTVARSGGYVTNITAGAPTAQGVLGKNP